MVASSLPAQYGVSGFNRTLALRLRADGASAGEVRAMWVQRGSLASPRTILSAVEMATKGGFNTLIVQVRGRGDAYYISRHDPRPSLLAR